MGHLDWRGREKTVSIKEKKINRKKEKRVKERGKKKEKRKNEKEKMKGGSLMWVILSQGHGSPAL